MAHDWSALLPPTWKEEVIHWIQQDIPKWDVGGFVVGDAPHYAMLLGKSEGVLAGVPFANFVFEYVGLTVDLLSRSLETLQDVVDCAAGVGSHSYSECFGQRELTHSHTTHTRS